MTTRVYDNLVSGVTGANYGLYVSDGIKLAVNLHSASNLGRNNFHNCSNISNVTLPSSTLQVDPQFISALNPTPTNTALRVLNGVGAL